jgi:hypothetical protein
MYRKSEIKKYSLIIQSNTIYCGFYEIDTPDGGDVEFSQIKA